jgi:DNA-binding MarR family transcriptional regulator
MIEAARAAARLHRTIEDLLEMAARRTSVDDLRVSDCWVLLALALAPPGTATASALIRGGSAAPHRSVALLRARGYLEAARSDADGRSRVLSLTDSGRRRVSDLMLAFDMLLDAGFGTAPHHLAGLADEVCAAARLLGRTMPA